MFWHPKPENFDTFPKIFTGKKKKILYICSKKLKKKWNFSRKVFDDKPNLKKKYFIPVHTGYFYFLTYGELHT